MGKRDQNLSPQARRRRIAGEAERRSGRHRKLRAQILKGQPPCHHQFETKQAPDPGTGRWVDRDREAGRCNQT